MYLLKSVPELRTALEMGRLNFPRQMKIYFGKDDNLKPVFFPNEW